MITCPRCKREVSPWPLGDRRICSPKDWFKCIRNDLENLSVQGDILGPIEAAQH